MSSCLPCVALLLLACGTDAPVAGPQAGSADTAQADVECQTRACIACQDQPDGAECDDGQPCTQGEVCAAGQCVGPNVCECDTNADCAARDDGDACNGVMYCEKAVLPRKCKLAKVAGGACPDDTECEEYGCDPTSGKCVGTPRPAATKCDDGQACTDSLCDGGGACKPTGKSAECACLSGDDCTKLDDGNPCNGTLFCDTASAPFTCAVNPASLVQCDPTTEPCRNVSCDPATGQCVTSVAVDKAGCDDGEACSVGDVCVSGSCIAGTWTCQCKTDAHCAGKDDGDKCNGVPYCDKASGVCTVNPATVVTCPAAANAACANNSCDPKTGSCGLIALNEGGGCDDDDACTGDETCKGGTCKATVNVCACKTDGDCASSEDGNLCNGTLYCDKLTNECRVATTTIVSCPTADNTACKTSVCAAETGKCALELADDATPCTDGDACTAGDSCQKGVCEPGSALLCPCATTSDCTKFEDGDSCNGTLYCGNKGGKPACLINPATVVQCSTKGDGPCQKTRCKPASGLCVTTFSAAAICDDGDVCTVKDLCADGECAGVKRTCDDQDGCTVDKCSAEALGCSHFNKSCDDGDVCTADSCNPATGACVQAFTVDPCDDGDKCSVADKCAAGKCAGTPKNCDDSADCTADKCVDGGCVHQPLSATQCDDGDACTTDLCVDGECVGLAIAATACDDALACTVDLCHPVAGCLHVQSDGSACDDANPCTAKDACEAGACKGIATAAVCDDDNACTEDSCYPQAGCQHLAIDGKCDDGDPCTGQGVCASGKCEAGADLGCGCKTTGDCATKEDGDACNGTLFCDKAAAPYKCRIAPLSIVVCAAANDPCQIGGCEKATGKCKSTARPDGASCGGDNSKCTVALCEKGSCKAGGALVCDDGNACTLDGCQDKIGCFSDASKFNGKACDDGDKCTVDSTCTEGACKGAKPANCGDGNVCTLDFCDATAGCTNAAGPLDGKPCSDANPCTVGDACSGATCGAGSAKSCDDSNPCTDDSCDAKKDCENDANSGKCDDNNACTGPDFCSGGKCGAAAISCDDNEPCTVDFCDPAVGCKHDAAPLDGKACVHPAGCVVGSFCNIGTCAGGDSSGCSNQGNCKLAGDSLYVTMGPGFAAQQVSFASDGSAWTASRDTTTRHWLTVRHDEFGAVAALKKTYQGATATDLRAVLALPDGGALVGGGSNQQADGHWQKWRSRVRRIDKTGKTVWQDKPGITTGVIRDFVQQTNGQFVFVAHPDSGGRSSYTVFTGDGKAVVNRKYKGPSGTYHRDHYHVSQLTPAKSGGFYSAGRLANPSKNTKDGGWLLVTRHSASALRQWERYLDAGYQAYLNELTVLSNGQLLAVGWQQGKAGAPHQPWILRLTSSGAVVSSKALPLVGAAEILSAVQPLADGGIVVGSYWKNSVNDSGWTARLTRLTTDMTPVWRSAWKPQTSTHVCAGCLQATGKGGWLVGGGSSLTSSNGTVISHFLARTDDWGHAPCKAAGVCAGLKAADCADGDACTHDLCDASKGCQNPKIAGCK